MLVPDETSQRVKVPACSRRQRYEQIRARAAGLTDGDASLRRFEEFPCAADRESKRL